ncbi:hypothetical protein RvY_17051 [Ramazzottius varieornatus]|uniref:Uncharacterized protein n=1 Tax=Ramazzottius varieornatus TaxID=947166 RepID=A0A1D1W4T0_RAMVA|nr:hypothetical protein RvY_17051 [Ramazzottius varieornatus]
MTTPRIIFSIIGISLCLRFSAAARFPMSDRLKARQADLLVMKATSKAPIDPTPADVQPSAATSAVAVTSNDALPVEDPNIQIISNPAGGEVVKGGAGIGSLMDSAADKQAQVPTSAVSGAAMPMAGAAVPPAGGATGSGAGASASYASAYAAATTSTYAVPVVTTPTSTYKTPAPSSYGASPSYAASSAPSPYPSPSQSPYGASPSSYGSSSSNGNNGYGSSGYASTASSYGASPSSSSYGSNSYSNPATTARPSYYSPPSSSGSYGGYGSGMTGSGMMGSGMMGSGMMGTGMTGSDMMGTGGGTATGTGTGTGTNATQTIRGVPYGYYTQVQYLPYAPLASQQLTNPIVFSPYLPLPNYILNRFGLPSVTAR